MNKFLTKIAKTFVGLSMATGIGVAVSAGRKDASSVQAAGGTFEKITSVDDLESGKKYLIVYSAGNLAFDGSLSTFDAVGNTKSVSISSNTITATTEFYFTITSKTGGYSLLGSSGKYAGQSSNANGLQTSSTDSYTNTISFDSSGNVNIVGGGAYLRYNKASNQTRFRYYKSSSYTGQEAIQLFKEKSTKTLSSISVSGATTSFTQGDTFSFGGTVTAHYSDSTTANVTSSATFSGYNMSTTGGQTVTVSYTEGGTTKTATYSITVNAPSKTLSSIAVTTAPTKTIYNEGESFDSAGMVVTATYSDDSTDNVTSSCSFSPSGALSTSNTSITITYTYGGTSKTATQAITVNEKHGTSTHPYTVAEAIADIDAGNGTGSTGAYATGIVSNIATAYSSQYSNVSFDIVDEMGDSVFLRAYRCGGTTAHPINSEDSVKVGDIVVVKGNLIYYSQSTLYEFSQGCTLEDITPNTISSLTVTDHSAKTWRVGDTVHTSDLSVVVNYSNIDPITVSDGTGVTITSGAELSTAGSNTVLVSYTDSYGTQTGSVSINAAAEAVLDSVSITGTATADKNGSWDFSDLVVTGTSDGGTTDDMGDITEHCVLTSSNSTATPGSTKITVHVNYKQGTKEIDVTNVDATISNVEKYTDNLTTATFGSPTSYTIWTGKAATNSGHSSAIYAGHTTSNSSAIQMKSAAQNNHYTGIVTTASGGDVKKVSLTWNSTTSADRYVDVYGKDTAYTSADDLYSADTRGTLIGTIEYGVSTELVITGSYQFVGLRSRTSALYLDEIDIEWSKTVQIKTLESLSITSNPTKTTYAAGESLNLNGLIVVASYEEDDVEDEQTVDFTASPADGYVFTTADGEAGSKVVTLTSNENANITTSFTVTVTPKIPTALNRTTAASWTDSQTLAQGAGRWKVVFSDSTEQTNIKIGDSNTVLKIGGVTVDTSSLAKNYAGQEATLEFTSQDITVSNTFTVSVTDELSVDSFDDAPEYLLVTETSEIITANFTSLNGEPDSYSVTSSNSAKLSVSFDLEMVEYNSSTHAGSLMFTLTAGSTQGEYSVIVAVTKDGRTESKTLPVLVRGEAPGGDEGSYRKISSYGAIPNGNYVIAANIDGTYYAMTSSLSGGKFAREAITVDSNGIIESTVENTMVFAFENTNSGITIKNGSNYVTYASSTNLGTSTTAYYFTAAQGVKGTFRLNSATSGRAIVYRASSYNVFGGYSTANITAAGTEYYDLELFEFVPAQSSGFDLVYSFVETNMHMSDVSLGNHSDTNACRGENGYYLSAKRAWHTMVSEYEGEDDLEDIFETSFTDAYERYMAWAAACGDSQPFVGTTIQNARISALFNKNSSNISSVAIIVIISMVSMTAIGGYFFLRKRKENI